MVMASPEHHVWSNGVCGGAVKDNGLISTAMATSSSSVIPVNDMLFSGVDLSCIQPKDEPPPLLSPEDVNPTLGGPIVTEQKIPAKQVRKEKQGLTRLVLNVC